jgi:hypothetical protein
MLLCAFLIPMIITRIILLLTMTEYVRVCSRNTRELYIKALWSSNRRQTDIVLTDYV